MRLTVQWQDRSREPHAGQFYMLRAWAADATPILSRPISVDDFDNQTGALTFLYQVKGEGTHKLAALKKDDTLTVTGPCGNGFDTAALAGQYKRIAVVGGGIGTAPLLLLCKELCRAGVRPDLFVGFRDTTYGHGPLCALVPRHLRRNRLRQGGTPRPGHRPAGREQVRHCADLRPHGHDARRG